MQPRIWISGVQRAVPSACPPLRCWGRRTLLQTRRRRRFWAPCSGVVWAVGTLSLGRSAHVRFCLALLHLDNSGAPAHASVDGVRERTPSGHDSVSAPDTFVISPSSGWAGVEVLAGDGAGTPGGPLVMSFPHPVHQPRRFLYRCHSPFPFGTAILASSTSCGDTCTMQHRGI